MSNCRYGPEDWRPVDELLGYMPIKEIAALVPMSEWTIRTHARDIGVDPIPARRKRKGNAKAINALLAQWGRPTHA